MFVLSDLFVLLLLDVAIISLPRSISRLVAMSLCARARVCVYVCLCLGLRTQSCFSRNEIASVNLNTCFCFCKFSIRYIRRVASHFGAMRSAFCPLRLSAPSQLTRVHAPVCV